MKYFWICFGSLVAYRILTNVSALARLNYHSNEYDKFLKNPDIGFKENTAALVDLFKKANVSDHMIPYVQPMGYCQLLQGQASLFCNMDNLREEVVANMLDCFAEARGTFKHRILESFSPLFWVDQVLFLPRAALSYLGVSGDSVIVKLIQLAYWLITPILLIFRDNLYHYVLSLLG